MHASNPPISGYLIWIARQQNLSQKPICVHYKIQIYHKTWKHKRVGNNIQNLSFLPKSSVEVEMSFLSVALFLTSIAFPLAAAFRSLDCKSFFSVPTKEQ